MSSPFPGMDPYLDAPDIWRGFHLAATVITALLQEWVDATVLFGVVLVNAIVGFLQESKAVTAIAALTRSLSSEATKGYGVS